MFFTGENNVTPGGTPRLSIHSNGKIVVNESNIATADFQVKGAASDNLLYVSAATNRVGIGTNVPAATLHVAGGAQVDGTLNLPNQTITNSSSAITVGQADARYLPAAASTNHVTFGSLTVEESTFSNNIISGTGLSMSFEDGAVEGRMVFQGTNIPSLDAAAKINFREELEVGATNDVEFKSLKLSNVGTNLVFGETGSIVLESTEAPSSLSLKIHGVTYLTAFQGTGVVFGVPVSFGTNAPAARASLELGPFATASTLAASDITEGVFPTDRLPTNTAYLNGLGAWAKTTNAEAAQDELYGANNRPLLVDSNGYAQWTNTLSFSTLSFNGLLTISESEIVYGASSLDFVNGQLVGLLGEIVIGWSQEDFIDIYKPLQFSASGVAAQTILNLGLSSWVTNSSAPVTTNATNLTAGILPDARLSTNVVVRDTNGLNIVGTQNTNLLYVSASTDRVGIGTNEPSETFHVVGNARIDGALRIEPQGDLAMGVYTNQP